MLTPVACLVVFALTGRVTDSPPPVADWAGDADPPAKKVAWPDKQPAIPVKVNGYPTVAFSDPGQKFVALRGDAGLKSPITLHDLTTGRTAGELPGTLPLAPPYSLNGDGTRFAACKPGTHSGPVFVYDVTTGKLLHEIATPAKPTHVSFLGGDRLVCLFGTEVVAYSTATGAQLWRVPAAAARAEASTISAAHLAVSPGRRFVAAVDGTSIRLVKADTGGAAGTLPVLVPRAERARAGSRVVALAFAPDGSRLTAVVATPAGDRAYTWDMRTGREVGYVPLPAHTEPGAIRGDVLSWSADGTTWFYQGSHLVDPATGKGIWGIPRNSFKANVRLLVGSHLLLDLDLPRPAARGQAPSAAQFEPVVLPKEKIEAARAAVRAGGVAAEGSLPKGVEIPRGPEPLGLPAADSNPWRVVPDPAPDLPSPARAVSLTATRDVESVHVGRAAVVELAPRTNFQLNPAKSRTLIRVDLRSGAEAGRLELPPGVALLAIDREAARAITIDAVEGRRLDIWSLDTGKHVVGWRPDPDHRDERGRVVLAELVGPDRMLTVTAGGQAGLWKLPAVEPVWRWNLERFDGRRTTPGGKYLVGVQGRFVRFINVATGELAGDVRLPFSPAASEELDRPGYANFSGIRMAVRPDGKEAVVLEHAAAARPMTAVRIDLATGKATAVPVKAPRATRVATSASGTAWDPPVYAGPDHVVTISGILDLRLGLCVFQIVSPSRVVALAAHPRGGFPVWHVQTRPDAGKAGPVLVATDLGATLADLGRRIDGPDALLGPGTRVSLAIRCEGMGREAGEKAIHDAVTKLAADRDWVVVEQSDVVIRLTAKETEVKAAKAGNRKAKLPERPGPKVKLTDIQATLTIEVRGAVAWSGVPIKVSGRTALIGLDARKEADLTQVHRARLWSALPRSLQLEKIPYRLLRIQSAYAPLPFQANLTADGAIVVEDAPIGPPAPSR